MAGEHQQGLPLWEALQKYSDPDRWGACEEAFRSGNHEQWKLLGELWDAFKVRLQHRELIATGFTGDINAQEIPADAWSFLESKSLGDLRGSVVSGGGTRVYGVRVRRTKKPPSSSIKTEKECRAWLSRLAASGYRPKSREHLFEKARKRFGTRLSKSAFLRAWADAAPDHWKKPGRRSRS